MLTVNDLTELENYIRSGELEADFKDGCENDRFYLLELLEKLMRQAHHIVRNLAGYIAARAVRLCLTGHWRRRRSCGWRGLLGWRCFYLRRRLRGGL